MAPVSRGEEVHRNVERVEKFGTVWKVITIVYYTGSDRYNVAVRLREKNGWLRKSDKYELLVNGGQTKESVKETAEELIEELFEEAGNKKQARHMDLDISIE